MIFRERYPLKKLNTFGIEAYAAFYTVLDNEQAVIHFAKNNPKPQLPLLILGGGSNLLFTGDFSGVVVRPLMKGIEIIEDHQDHCLLAVKAGTEWDSLVAYAVDRDLYGLENLSGIPGSVGACPIQNIGAYGAEVKDAIASVEAIMIHKGEKIILKSEECRFSYRNSIFKQELKGKLIITRVIFHLEKHGRLMLSYGDVEEETMKLSGGSPDLKTLRQAILNIRNRKLPDTEKAASAGSFFKNPVVGLQQYELLNAMFPGMPAYAQTGNTYKLSAAWLIEQCGWKSFRRGDAAVYDRQALILVNYGNATGREILQLAQDITTSVKDKFNILIEAEVNII